jgi:hypothetical protein
MLNNIIYWLLYRNRYLNVLFVNTVIYSAVILLICLGFFGYINIAISIIYIAIILFYDWGQSLFLTSK